ncbi:uncharacterized protein DUF1700 [Anaeroplasma bactoclasticum]|jgi:DUF4097 and DUF4098 domain-containing protein YvlB|uniref:Uncharacterized protein DUF1700 n=1 Tax=Anaeroplasma bactoclasticum TaxID=2088 RepID=A0A397S001_9MOLU|nr:DUF4097 family beta strand repeat-containing protein [Anaeroplasma bactoclasticum]RIA75504.1 uncharacterized protein DUF1700 [Anaeroplasma bactoclasticum]
MKDSFLNELEEKLRAENVSNVSEIVNKYSKRYDFGLESGLSEEEIENMLGSVDEIVNLYKTETRYEYKESFGNLKLNVSTVTDNVEFERSKDNEVHVYFENIDENSYEISKTDKEISVSYINKKFFGLNRRRPGTITVALPQGLSLGKTHLSTVSGDINSDIDLDSEYLTIEMVSGDSELKRIASREIKIHVVSGDFEIDEITTTRIEVSTVSGDIEIEKLYADELNSSSVSGDIDIKEASRTMKVKSSSISGSIKINETKYKNFDDKMKEF